MKATQDEHWLPVAGYEGIYEVSDFGRVRSLDRVLPNDHHPGRFIQRRGRILRPSTSGGGYPVVCLCVHGQEFMVKVHRLVAQAFIGPCPDDMEVCHNNGDPADNRVENLRYDTHSANAVDRVVHGHHHNSNKTHCPQGHPYNAENTWLYKGGRHCLCCRAERAKRKSA